MAQTFKSKTLISRTGVFSHEINAPNIVYNTGSQTIDGLKNFTTRPQVNNVNVLLEGEGVGSSSLPSTVFYTTGNQSVSGVKIFSGDGVSLDFYSGARLLISGNPVLTGVDLSSLGSSANLATTGSNLYSYVSSLSGELDTTQTNIATTGSNLSSYINSLSGELVTTGSNLYSYISSLSGELDATQTNIATTGSNLSSYINSLSGELVTTGSNLYSYISSLSGELDTIQNDTTIATTGSNLYSYISSLSGELDATQTNIATTGSNLSSYINSLSGELDTTQTNIATTGSNLSSYINSLSGELDTTQTNIATTGSNLYTYINSLSGELDGTQINISTTGSNLSSYINSLSGELDVTQTNLYSTGSSLYTYINSISGELDGAQADIILSGANLYQYTSSLSGEVVLKYGNQNISGNKVFLNNINVSGTGFFENINISNLGELVISGAKVRVEGNSGVYINTSLYVSGNPVLTGLSSLYSTSENLNLTGSNLYAYVNSLSGELDTTQSNLYTTGSNLYSYISSLSGELDTTQTNIGTTGYNLHSYISSLSGELDLTQIDISTTGSNLHLYINSLSGELDSTQINISSTGSNLYNYISSLSGELDSTQINIESTGSTLHNRISDLSGAFNISGANLQDRLTGLSGAFNLTGANLFDRINSLSGAAVLTYGNQLISGNKTFVNNLEVQGTGIFNSVDLSNISEFSFSGVTINLRDSVVQSSGQIYISGNPVLTGVDLSSFPTSSNVALTGSTLYSYINSLSGESVLLYGNQSINGIKDFNNQITVSGVKFDVLTTTQTPAHQEGMLYYSDDTKTLNLDVDVAGLKLPIGQENWLRAKNGTTTTMAAGTVVYITGGQGNTPLVKRSIATNDAGSATTIAVAAHSINSNSKGFFTTFGIVENINTSYYEVGDTLYLSWVNSGELTGVKPQAPNHMVRIGNVLDKGNNGSIFVSIQNGFEIDELHDVRIVNKQDKDGIVYNSSSGLWLNTPVALKDELTNLSGTFNLTGANLQDRLASLSGNVVFLTGDQNISGLKAFKNNLTINDNLLFTSQSSGFVTGINYSGNGDGGYFLGGIKLKQNRSRLVDGSFGKKFKELTIGGTGNKKWHGATLNSDGQYQTATVNNQPNSGYIYTSNNYGQTWTAITGAGSRYWNNVRMSKDGKYQLTWNYDANLYLSKDYGTNWSPITSLGNQGWQAVSLSSEGKYQTAVTYYSDIYISQDYGATWLNKSFSNQNFTNVALSSDGKYQTVTTTYSGALLSKDYGNTWVNNTGMGLFNNYGLALSSDGQYQTVGKWAGYIYISKDYGNSWKTITDLGFLSWIAVSMSQDGKYQATTSYGDPFICTSVNYGETWQKITPFLNKTYNDIHLTSDGKFLIAAQPDHQIILSTTDELIDGNFYADNLIYTSGNQTINGIKTFASDMVVSGTGIFNGLNLENISSILLSGMTINITGGSTVNAFNPIRISGFQVLTGVNQDSRAVLTTTNQGIGGIKTFFNTGVFSDLLFANKIYGRNATVDIFFGTPTNAENIVITGGRGSLGGLNADVYIAGGESTNRIYLQNTTNLRGCLNITGGQVYISGNPVLTGVDLSLYATISNLALTGSVLQDRISNLSGVFNTTGASLQDRLTNLSGAFNITGANLQDRLTSLSGAFNTTGANLQNRLTSLSGAFNTTGANLHDRLTTLSGQVVFLNNAQTITGSKTFIGTTTFSGQEVNLIDTALNLSGVGDMTFSSTNINFINSPVFISGTDFRVSGNIYGYNMFVSGNPVLTGIPDGSWATQNELEGLSGAFNLTGANLQDRLTSLSGAFNLTGANLQDRLTSFSGIALIRDRNQTHSGDLTVTGHFSAASKSFLIDHPTKIGKKLQYGSLEGPENGVYVRGKTNQNIINLPLYWEALVDNDSISVNLTPIYSHQNLYVLEYNNRTVKIDGNNSQDYFYVVYGERKDIPKLTVEF